MGSLQVKSALSQLGRDIQTARKRRRMSVADFCSRIGVSDKTLAKLERGDGGVRLETFAMALLALGMLDRLAEIADPSSDATGIGLDRDKLPERIRQRGRHIRTIPTKSKDAPKGTVVVDDDEGTAF
ncbi:transcriptional regulator, XRE family (plasmid) [Phaeobacter inhibens]|uniref:Transcriptional regulator, XRE family n=2 Tax=Phaeobacter inhibens TaxID=221822 RepID=A0ABM6RKP4_9RHOB|nr:helix-turn-helix transcriptional regulator [Phaeobacter inhibens]AUQ52403.1 transcriptional regulator, XRE family [Phaeobacter inhibens]AUQ97008.1 transcriptional regulator, XRE family [Phaeobacter inhibens]AUR22208.1 transcriptional regulator, XRE family [Phaeobacter inhibens]